jgi:sugar transferase (PEP-CTERM/EpsH1 system associated)
MAVKVVHVVHRFDTGGMENGMVNLFNNMDAGKFEHVVIALSDFSDFRQRITAQPVEFHALHRQPGHDLAWMPRLWKLLRKLKPDLVHTRNLSALEAQFVAAAAGIRATIHGEHGRDVFDLYGKNWKYNLLRRAAQPLVYRYIAVSQDLAGWLEATIHVPQKKIRQIYNGVDCVKFHPRGQTRPDVLPPDFATDESFVIGSVGRMAEVKDYPTLVRAFIRLVRDNAGAKRRARLVIAGEGVARQQCMQLLTEAGLSDQAWLPGERHDIADIMRALDVFVLPSLNEGISNTILEAQASGLPVIATRVGGNVELVEEGINGCLFAPGDEAVLAQALLTYFQDEAMLDQQGSEARKRVESRFSIPAMARAYETVYEQVLTR